MSDFSELLHAPTVNRLGWTLVHFLWQGTVIAGLFAVVQYFFRTSSPNFRYWSGCVALLAMLIVPLATFVKLGNGPGTSNYASTMVVGTPMVEGEAPLQERVLIHELPTQAAVAPERKRNLIGQIVFVWVIGVAAFSIRLLVGGIGVFRLRQSGTIVVEPFWTERLDRIKTRLGIRCTIQLVKSGLIDVPMAAGWLRPLIIIPIASFTRASTDQIEAILAHELAHIRRQDYLVNVIQNAVEALFFYHPAVWWVSRYVRMGRECCCDDLAIEVCGDKLRYSTALATLEGQRNNRPLLAMGSDGGSLLQRIQRICGMKPSMNYWSRAEAFGAVTVTLLVLIVVCSAEKLEAGKGLPPVSKVQAARSLPEWVLVKPVTNWLAEAASPDNDSSKLARLALKELGTNALPEIYKILDNKDKSEEGDSYRYRTAELLSIFKVDVLKTALPTFLQFLNSGNEPTAYAGARALAFSARKYSAAFAELTNGLISHSAGVRNASTHGVGLCLQFERNDFAEPALPQLVRMLEDKENYVRNGAAGALYNFVRREKMNGTVQHAYPDLSIPALMKALDDSYSYTRLYAMSALAEYGTLAKAALPKLYQLRNDASTSVRRQVERVIQAIESHD